MFFLKHMHNLVVGEKNVPSVLRFAQNCGINVSTIKSIDGYDWSGQDTPWYISFDLTNREWTMLKEGLSNTIQGEIEF